MTEEEQVGELVATHSRAYSVRFPGMVYMGAEAVIRSKPSVLLHDHGFDTAKRALEIVFTHPQCQWVKDKHVDLLNDQKRWNKHIQPILSVVTTVRSGVAGKGEQSEFGARPEGKGSRRVW